MNLSPRHLRDFLVTAGGATSELSESESLEEVSASAAATTATELCHQGSESDIVLKERSGLLDMEGLIDRSFVLASANAKYKVSLRT